MSKDGTVVYVSIVGGKGVIYEEQFYTKLFYKPCGKCLWSAPSVSLLTYDVRISPNASVTPDCKTFANQANNYLCDRIFWVTDNQTTFVKSWQ